MPRAIGVGVGVPFASSPLGFNPGSVFDENGNSLLQQYIGTTLEDTKITDKARKGTPRDIQPGRAYDFDGTDDYVDVATMQALGGEEYTSAAWVRVDGGAGTRRCVYETAPTNFTISLEVSASDVFHGYAENSGGTLSAATGITPTIGEWYHVVTTYDNGTLSVYVNGKLEGSHVIAGTLSLYTGFHIGTFRSANARWLNGAISDVRIYNDVLTQDEIEYIYTYGSQGTDPTVTNLIGQWKCDEGAGTASYDSSGNGNDGTITDATLSTFHYTGSDVPYSYPNEVGYSGALTFDGVDDEVTAPSVISSDDTCSFAYWAYFNSFTNSPCIVTFNSTWYSLVTSGGVVKWQVGAGGLTGFNTISTGEWHHFAFVKTAAGDNGICYMDGVVQAQTSGALGTAGASTSTLIGRWSGASNKLDGYVSDVRVYDDILTADEVTYLATGGVSGDDPTTTNLQAEWLLNDGTANDTSGNANHGTISGATPHFVPRDESDTSNNIIGVPLDYSGEVPHDAKFVESNCGTFDGSNDYITIPESDDWHLGTGDFEIEWTMDATTSALGDRIVVYRSDPHYIDGFQIWLDSDQVTLSIGLASATYAFTSENYAGICTMKATRVSGSLSLYKDGVQQGASQSATDDVAGNATYALEIGRTPNSGGGSYYHGLLSNFKIKKGTSTVGHWPLSEGAGTTIHDVSGNDNHGTATSITESTFWGTTQDIYHHNISKGFDGALTFDGTDDYIDSSVAVGVSVTNLSFSAWAYFTSVDTTFQHILGSFNGTTKQIVLRLADDDKIEFSTFDGSSHEVKSTGVIAQDTWIHIVGVFNGTDYKLYLDGSLDNTTTDSTFSPETTINLFIGARNQAGSDTLHVEGSLSDVRYYDDELTADEVTHIYTGGTSGDDPTTTNLVGQWKLNDGSGTTATDSSSGGNDGTLTNFVAPYWTRVPAQLDGTSTINGGVPSNPAVIAHNNAESALDFTGGQADAPWVDKIYQGHALFDGTDDNVTFDEIDLGTTCSFSIWGNGTTDDELLFGAALVASADYGMYFVGGNVIINEGSGGASVSFAFTRSAGWHHYTVTRAGTTVKFYEDGVLIDTGTLGANTSHKMGSLTSYGNDVRWHWTGSLSDARVYNDTLTADEVTYLHTYGASGTDPTTTNLQGHWPLSRGHALDLSSNNNHGTVVGATFPTYTIPVSYNFSDAFTPSGQTNHFKRVVSTVKEDRFLLYSPGLTGANLTDVQDFTT